MSERWKKAIPLFMNAAFFTALGVFALVGTIPVVFAGIVAIVGVAANVLLGIAWKPPTTGE